MLSHLPASCTSRTHIQYINGHRTHYVRFILLSSFFLLFCLRRHHYLFSFFSPQHSYPTRASNLGFVYIHFHQPLQIEITIKRSKQQYGRPLPNHKHASGTQVYGPRNCIPSRGSVLFGFSIVRRFGHWLRRCDPTPSTATILGPPWKSLSSCGTAQLRLFTSGSGHRWS
jgi:hypothetical protein